MSWVLVAFASPALAGSLSILPNESAATEVRWSDAGSETLLETFTGGEGVVGKGVSADGRWAFVWHQPKGKSLRVSVYDLQSRKRSASFSPGYGGQLVFSAANTLVLTHGCGTSCHTLTVYDLTGKELMGVAGSSNELSPNGKYVLDYPDLYSESRPITLYEAESGRKLAEFGGTDSGEVGVDDLKWGSSDVVAKLMPRSGTGAPRYVRLSADGTTSWVEATTP